MRLRRATSGDIPEIMAIERQPGYETLVGQWSAEQHAAHLDDPSFHYFVAGDRAKSRPSSPFMCRKTVYFSTASS